LSKENPTDAETEAAAVAAATEAANIPTGDGAKVAPADQVNADAKPPATVTVSGQASYRVLRKGEGHVFTGRYVQDEEGRHVAETYAPGAIVHGAPRAAVLQLEDRGFVELVKDGDAD